MSLSIIAAMTDDGVIGRDNKLPWHLSDDLKRFKEITMGHPIIMGRKTFDSLKNPLPGRHNIIVSRNPTRRYLGATVVGSLEEALDHFGAVDEELFVIGGAQIFELALPDVDTLYLTIIHHKIEGDTYFPKFDLENNFRIVEKTDHQSATGDKLRYTFLKAERI
jgi:dihydrofolate reductase